MLFLAIPLFALSWRAIAHLDNLQEAGRATVVDALVLSATTSLTSLVVIIGLGTPLAFGIARRSFRGKSVLETLIDLPMVMPPAVAGLALLMAFGRRGVLGSWLDDAGIRIGFTTTAVIAYSSITDHATRC